MMKKINRSLFLAVTTVMAMSCMCIPSYAATRKKITSIRVDVESHIQPETKFGDEEVEVKIPSSAKYSYDNYEIENVGFEWYEDDIPEITIVLYAEDGYYFGLNKASSIKLTGATYKTASREDSSETLKLTVTLPSLREQVGELGEVVLTTDGYAYWDIVRGAGSYEMRFYRNGTAVGATETVTEDTMFNLRQIISRPGTYSVKVRPRNSIKEENKGAWVESNTINISAEQANRIREGIEPQQRPQRGEWMHDDIGGYWYRYDDNSYPKNDWAYINNKWYFFDENGYMKTGWITWNGKEYYCKENTGEMLTNTTTPDGYLLDENGNKRND